MAISFKTDSGDFGSLNITGTAPADFKSGINSSGSNYLEDAYITGSNGSWIKLDDSADVWEINGSKVYYTGGNVGIGTSSPSEKLDVSGIMLSQRLKILNDYSALYFNKADASVLGYLMMRDDGSNYLSYATGQSFSILHGSDNHFTITSGGNVGIGTNNPSTSLNIVTDIGDDGIFLESSSYRMARLFNDSTYGRLSLYKSGVSYFNINPNVAYSSGMQLGVGYTAEFINRMGEAKATLDVQCAASGHTGIQVMSAAYDRRVFYVTNEGNAHLGPNASGLSVTSGRVGIGTTNPDALLEIAATTNPELRITDTNPGSAAAATFRAENSSVTVGSYSDDPLHVVTNNSTKMTLLSGNVGIGTTTPFSTMATPRFYGLHVEGQTPTVRLTDNDPGSEGMWDITNNNGVFTINSQDNDGSSSVNHLVVKRDGNVGIGTSIPEAYLHVTGASSSVPSAIFDNRAGNDGVLILAGNNGVSSERVLDVRKGNVAGDITGSILVANAGGNVGIGTTTPSAPLEILTTSDYPLILNQSGTTPWNQIGFHAEGAIKGTVGRIGGGAGHPTGIALTALAGDDLHLRTGPGSSPTDTRFTILNSNGNVGIGTATPEHKLQVSGGSAYLESLYVTGSDGSWGQVTSGGGGGGGGSSVITSASWTAVPATASSAGNNGNMARDDNYIYVCISNNTWKRTALATW